MIHIKLFLIFLLIYINTVDRQGSSVFNGSKMANTDFACTRCHTFVEPIHLDSKILKEPVPTLIILSY